jgi:hypothetical protein
MFPYHIDDSTESPQITSVEVTIDFPTEKRWLFFCTPELLASVGDFVEGTETRIHLGERHMIVVGTINPEIIDTVLRQLAASGELLHRTLPLSPGA